MATQAQSFTMGLSRLGLIGSPAIDIATEDKKKKKELGKAQKAADKATKLEAKEAKLDCSLGVSQQ